MEFKFENKVLCPLDPSTELFQHYPAYYGVKNEILQTNFPDAKIIGEIGVRAGYSAWAFLQACPGAEFHGFDMEDPAYGGSDGKFSKWAIDLLKDYNFNYHKINSQEVDTLMEGKEFDFIHVDGDHTKGGVMHDLDICLKALSPNPKAFLLIDDYSHPQLPAVKEGVDEWLENNKDKVVYEYKPSLRGEIVIHRK